MRHRSSLILLAVFVFLVSWYPPTSAQLRVVHVQSHTELHSQFEPYVEYLNEFTQRRRLKMYFANEQSIFYGAQVEHVNVGRGNLTFVRRDLVTVGRLPLVVARVYDSSLNAGGDFGKGWHLSAAETIKREPDGSLVLMTESATPVRFARSGDHFIQAKPCPTDIIDVRQVDPAHFQVKLRTGFLREYTLIGDLYRLTGVKDRNGNLMILEYQSGKLARIRGQRRGSINIERDDAGRIILVRDHHGRTVSYGYNESGQLTRMTDLGGNHWRYEYNELGNLRKAVNPLGIDFAVVYDGQQRVTELQDSGLGYRYRYETAARQTTVIDGRGSESSYTQNEDGITTAITNVFGIKTRLVLNERNTVEGLYRNDRVQAEMEYDGEGRLVSLVKHDSQGPAQMNYVYDTMSRLAEIRSVNDRLALGYDARGNLLEKLNRDGVVRYGYSSTGDLLMMSFGDAISLRFEVDDDGQITSVKDRQDRQTRFKYNDNAELSEARFADGSLRAYQYDRLGMRRLRQFDGRARVEYAHNATGSLTEIDVMNADGTADGQRLTLDEGQKVRVIERLTGAKSFLSYDRAGNLEAVTTGERVLRFTYDRRTGTI